MKLPRVKPSAPAVPVALRDPGVQAVVVLALLAVAGFVMLGLAWRGAARTVYVPLQSPWVMSGGVAGLGLLGMALGAWSIHEGRRRDAEHRAVMEDLVREAAELAEDVRSGRRSLPRRWDRTAELDRCCRTWSQEVAQTRYSNNGLAHSAQGLPRC